MSFMKRVCEVLVNSGLALPSEIRGCSSEEIEHLESLNHVRIPETYRRFLEAAGHGAGRMFQTDNVKWKYDYVLDGTQKLKTQFLNLDPPASVLGENPFVILNRLGQEFFVINAVPESDSTVFYFNTWDRRLIPSQPSVIAWVETWLQEALQALDEGFDFIA